MFAEQIIWITGASSGIGAALARAWAGAGARLILSGRRRDALEQVAAACAPAECLILPFEATDFAALPTIVEQALAWKGRVDILVNNAGISQRSLAVDTELPVYQRLMDVDFFGPVALTQQLLPHFVQRGSGRVVQIASVAGKVGVPLRTGYCAAKHALIGYSDALRAELAPYGIQVHVVIPGFVRTEIAKNALRAGAGVGGEDPVDSGMDPGRAAAAILRGMDRGLPEIPVGEGREMGALWLRRLWPGLLFRQVALRSKP
ncbi:MAG TPA: SDR family NAD(P)-dependent oxidoreductase [Myxococcota bacterium]|nr:SDR family NAD(P)-dependent oxidoreductase [Myxococcota bacterium]